MLRSGVLETQESTNIGRYLLIFDVLLFLKTGVTGVIFNLSGNAPSLREMFTGVKRLLKLFLTTLKFISSYSAVLVFAKKKRVILTN